MDDPPRLPAPDERRALIAELLAESGPMPVKDLRRRLSYSTATVYRDIADLQAQGQVLLSRGIVVPQRSSATEIPPQMRAGVNIAAKRAMCGTAIGFISPGMTIIIDDSSTILPLVDRLAERAPLTVLTNSCAVITRLKKAPGIDLYSLGGMYYPWLDSYHGLMTISALESIEADLAVFSTVGITSRGVSNPYEYTAQTKTAMMRASRESLVLVDHTKFGHRAMHSVAPLASITRLVTDRAPAAEPSLEELEAAGVRVTIV